MKLDAAASVWIGFDPRETAAFAVARESLRNNMPQRLPTYGVVLSKLRKLQLYSRPTEMRLGRLWDVISEAHMSTEFAISRFLVPTLARTGWAMFMDCDVLVRGGVNRLFEMLDDQYALYCVKHVYEPVSVLSKMGNQQQTFYPRKNWSSVMIFNCDHPANKKLTVELVNTVPGRDLHRFCWLADEEIGELPSYWNWLVGEQPQPENPQLVHYTLGYPGLGPQFHDQPFADEWFHYLEQRWAA